MTQIDCPTCGCVSFIDPTMGDHGCPVCRQQRKIILPSYFESISKVQNRIRYEMKRGR